jgi:PPP family 3-phenylpropionic acid transporter
LANRGLAKASAKSIQRTAPTVPYFRLSGFYLFYFGALGAFVPYWGLYLQAEGYNPAEIGELMAILAGTKLVAPNIWGWIADRSGKALAIVRLAALMTACTFAGVCWLSGYFALALITLAFSFFWNASLPSFEAITLNHLRQEAHRYSHIRLWGSLGFVACVLAVGSALETMDIHRLPLVIGVLLIGTWVFSQAVPEAPTRPHAAPQPPMLRVLGRPAVVAFFLVFTLIQAAHGPYYAFFSIYLQQHGYSSGETGQLWALGVLAEIIMFALVQRLLRRYSLRAILLTSILLGTVRWSLIACCLHPVASLMFAQLLHAATFGSSHVVAIQLVHRYFQGRNQTRGQALYNSLSFGLGGMLGSLYSGYFWEQRGAAFVYAASAGLSLLAFFIAWGWLERGGQGIDRRRDG